MIDYNRPEFAHPKGETVYEHRQKRRAQWNADDRRERERRWKESKGICPRCGLRMVRGAADARVRAEYNHESRICDGGRRTHKGGWCHGICHRPNGVHVRRVNGQSAPDASGRGL